MSKKNPKSILFFRKKKKVQSLSLYFLFLRQETWVKEKKKKLKAELVYMTTDNN
jgi:hypothetical protein